MASKCLGAVCTQGQDNVQPEPNTHPRFAQQENAFFPTRNALPTRRYGLMVGAYSANFVRFLQVMWFPVAWPISKLLDLVLGSNESALFKRAQLKALVDIHAETEGGLLSSNEVRRPSLRGLDCCCRSFVCWSVDVMSGHI